jgi:hypothetical protein
MLGQAADGRTSSCRGGDRLFKGVLCKRSVAMHETTVAMTLVPMYKSSRLNPTRQPHGCVDASLFDCTRLCWELIGQHCAVHRQILSQVHSAGHHDPSQRGQSTLR